MELSQPKKSTRNGLKLVLLAAAILALYYPILAKLVLNWWHDPDFSHGFLIPPLAGYLVWRRREQLAASETRPTNWGLLGIFGAVALLFLGSLGAELYLTRISLVIMLAALAAYLFGWKRLRLLLFPLAVLLLMIPIPAILYTQLTFPLQLTASKFASHCLSGVGVPVLQEGNLITLPHDITLEVAEACSGIRSLMALLALGVAYGYFFESRITMRLVLILLTIPIAVISNGLRITGTGVLTYLIGQDMARGFFHFFEGWMVFIFAFALLIAMHRLIRMFFRLVHGKGAA